ncbi:hypothetical protein [Anoxybacteroides amylolyticum]|uniref:Uncharacterized protein n=1 Tax=Anoxybacteroides amylolyticum TaxID=294699 RepID=A0A167TLR9_9BACL|nr:hypothetical protein [Anoxybacillus amylolyticus]ANB61370.1 hypothetical protein GFC30_2391 [Anoxybacillus amylolyticus]
MSMPEIPKMTHRPDKKEVIIDLLESIALEEVALSHILNAEAEKIQAFVGKCLDFPTKPNNHEILTFNKSVQSLLETVVMKEWLLLKKLEDVLEFLPPLHHGKCCCPSCKENRKHPSNCHCPICEGHEKHHANCQCPTCKEHRVWKGYES